MSIRVDSSCHDGEMAYTRGWRTMSLRLTCTPEGENSPKNKLPHSYLEIKMLRMKPEGLDF